MAKRKRPELSAVGAAMADTPDQAIEMIEKRKAATESTATPKRVKMTISIDADLLHELRVIASTLPPALFPSISGAIVEATRNAVEELRKAHNGGEPFTSDTPPKVRTGRRPG